MNSDLYHSLGFKDSKYQFRVATAATYQYLSIAISTLTILEQGTLGWAYLATLDYFVEITAGVQLDAGATLIGGRGAVAVDLCRK